jgi:ribosomal protein L37AE/L43A
MEGVALAERKRRSSTDVAVKAMQDHLASVLTEMEQLGIVTQLAGKVGTSSGRQQRRRAATRADSSTVAGTCRYARTLRSHMYDVWLSCPVCGLQIVGGVAMTHSYYQHVLLTEGRADEVQPCQLLITKLRGNGDVAMLPALQVCAGRYCNVSLDIKIKHFVHLPSKLSTPACNRMCTWQLSLHSCLLQSTLLMP